MPDGSGTVQSTFEDWEQWFTLRGLYLDSSAGAASAFRSLGSTVTLPDLDVVWSWVQAKRGLDSTESYFMAQVNKPGAFLKLVAKVRMFQADGAKPAMRNMGRTPQQEHDDEVRDEFIAAHCQERRTVEWSMRREKLLRSEVIAILVQRCPYFVTAEMYEGPPSPWELPDTIVESWRREDESDIIHQERVALFTAAAARKEANRRAASQPMPGEKDRNGLPVTPEDICIADF